MWTKDRLMGPAVCEISRWQIHTRLNTWSPPSLRPAEIMTRVLFPTVTCQKCLPLRKRLIKLCPNSNFYWTFCSFRLNDIIWFQNVECFAALLGNISWFGTAWQRKTSKFEDVTSGSWIFLEGILHSFLCLVRKYWISMKIINMLHKV